MGRPFILDPTKEGSSHSHQCRGPARAPLLLFQRTADGGQQRSEVQPAADGHVPAYGFPARSYAEDLAAWPGDSSESDEDLPELIDSDEELQRQRAHDQVTQSRPGEERVPDLNPFSWDQRQRMVQGVAGEHGQREAAAALQFAWDPRSRDGAQPQGGSGRPDPRRFRDIGRFMRQNVNSTTRQRGYGSIVAQLRSMRESHLRDGGPRHRSWQRETAVNVRGRRSAEADPEIPAASTQPAWRESTQHARHVAQLVMEQMAGRAAPVSQQEQPQEPQTEFQHIVPVQELLRH